MLSQIFFAETKRALSFDQKIGKAKVQLFLSLSLTTPYSFPDFFSTLQLV